MLVNSDSFDTLQKRGQSTDEINSVTMVPGMHHMVLAQCEIMGRLLKLCLNFLISKLT